LPRDGGFFSLGRLRGKEGMAGGDQNGRWARKAMDRVARRFDDTVRNNELFSEPLAPAVKKKRTDSSFPLVCVAVTRAYTCRMTSVIGPLTVYPGGDGIAILVGPFILGLTAALWGRLSITRIAESLAINLQAESDYLASLIRPIFATGLPALHRVAMAWEAHGRRRASLSRSRFAPYFADRRASRRSSGWTLAA
jgi:hypothetical protein